MNYLEALSDIELADKAAKEVDDLCDGKKRWRMAVPVDFERDSDVLFAELIQRFRQTLEGR